MHGARLVNTPAMNRIGSAVSGLEDSWVEIWEKSTIVRMQKRDAIPEHPPLQSFDAARLLLLGQKLLEQIDRPLVA